MALPADISPPPAPGDRSRSALDEAAPDESARPGGTGERTDAGQPVDADSGDAVRKGGSSAPGQQAGETGSLPGLPRLFFAPGHEQRGHPAVTTSPYGQSAAPSHPATPSQQTASGQPPAPSQPAAPGQGAEPGQAGGFGHSPGGGPNAQPGQSPPFGQQFGQPTGFGGQQPSVGPQPGGGRPLPRPPARPTRSARTRPTRPPDRELRHRAIASLVLGVLALVALLGLSGNLSRGVYLLIFSAVIGIAACVIGITAVIKARKTGSYRPRGAVGGIVLGAMAALLSIPILATYLAFPHQVDNYVKCVNQSQSSGGQQTCMNRFYKSIHVGAAEAAGAHRTAPSLPHGTAQGKADGPPGRAAGGSSWSPPHLSI
jgi:hypothetical protein